MDQMADKMTLGVDAKGKGRVNAAEQSSTWVRGERTQSEAEVGDWRLDVPPDTRPGETSRDADARRPRQRDGPPSLLSLKMRRSSPAGSSGADPPSSSRRSSTGVDCAGIVLSCLFCRFYDMILMLPDSCGRVANHCCPGYKQVTATAASTPSGDGDDDSFTGLDCGLFTSCQDTSECLELAMEMSELCYR